MKQLKTAGEQRLNLCLLLFSSAISGFNLAPQPWALGDAPGATPLGLGWAGSGALGNFSLKGFPMLLLLKQREVRALVTWASVCWECLKEWGRRAGQWWETKGVLGAEPTQSLPGWVRGQELYLPKMLLGMGTEPPVTEDSLSFGNV